MSLSLSFSGRFSNSALKIIYRPKSRKTRFMIFVVIRDRGIGQTLCSFEHVSCFIQRSRCCDHNDYSVNIVHAVRSAITAIAEFLVVKTVRHELHLHLYV